MSRIRANNIVNGAGTGAPTFPNGAIISGIATVNADIDSNSNLTANQITSLQSIGVGTGATVTNPANNELAFNTNGTERVRVDSSGNVGIGTEEPTKALHISQNSDVAIRLQARNANVDNTSWEIVVGGNASNDAEMVFRTRNDAGTGGSEIARFTTGGDLKFPSGGGIDFSANSNASGMASELLDDYEEGTWTPNGSYTFTHATYTKIGRQVFCQFTCTNPSGMGGVSLPFTPSNTVTGSGDSDQVRYVGDVQFFVSGGNDDSTYKYIWQGNIGTSMYLHKLSGAGAQTWTATFGSNVSQVTAFISFIVS